jgi:hypothetical protein
MNTSNIIKLVACLAWAGVAVSSARPADAYAITTQTGTYATCAAQSSTLFQEWCIFAVGEDLFYRYETGYVQQIKFVSTACNQGGCTPDATQVAVDFAYPVGRKTVTSHTTCGANKNVYGLGTCAC